MSVPVHPVHPVLVCLLVALLIGVVHNVLSPTPRMHVGSTPRDAPSIGVVLVVPPRASMETQLLTTFHSATTAHVRFYVAKMCAPDETPEALQDMQIRVVTRVHYVNARTTAPAVLRARLLADVTEEYALVVGFPHTCDMGWDRSLLAALHACPRHAVLSHRLAKGAEDAPVATCQEWDGARARFVWKPYAAIPKRPQPSLAASTHLVFGDAVDLCDAWPGAAAARDGGEDATVTAHLWMRGVDVFSPACACVARPPDAPDEPSAMERVEWPTTRVARTRRELLTFWGLRAEKPSSRSRLGLTQDASAAERFAKVGQTLPIHREL